MRQELDEYLCSTYPKLFVDRNAPMSQTCMCWGFSHGDGWYNIINQLCSNIQHHIDWRERQVESATKYNKIAEAGKTGNAKLFADLCAEEFGDKNLSADYVKKRCEEMLIEPLRKVPDECPQVTINQVKEKFGTLRFYYSGGDDEISGMVRMAESMSGCTCEECGASAETSSADGWVSTRCPVCKEASEK